MPECSPELLRQTRDPGTQGNIKVTKRQHLFFPPHVLGDLAGHAPWSNEVVETVAPVGAALAAKEMSVGAVFSVAVLGEYMMQML